MVMSYQSKPHEPVTEPYPVTRDFMSRSFVKVTPDMEIYDAMDLLVRHKTTGAPVVNERDELLGIISERDCLQLAEVVLYSNNDAALGTPVSDYMTTDVRSVGPDAGLHEVADLFLKLPFKKLPVVENGRVIGLVRRHAVLTALRNYHKTKSRNSFIRSSTAVRKRGQ